MQVKLSLYYFKMTSNASTRGAWHKWIYFTIHLKCIISLLPIVRRLSLQNMILKEIKKFTPEINLINAVSVARFLQNYKSYNTPKNSHWWETLSMQPMWYDFRKTNKSYITLNNSYWGEAISLKLLCVGF